MVISIINIVVFNITNSTEEYNTNPRIFVSFFIYSLFPFKNDTIYSFINSNMFLKCLNYYRHGLLLPPLLLY